MALKIIRLERRPARMLLLAAVLLCVLAAWFFAKWNFANTIAARMDTNALGADRVADWLVGAAPFDPQTHLTAAIVHEKTLDPSDLDRSLHEYEEAAALSPNDYLRWLDLGKARGVSGDDEGSRAAYARAMEIAPNYAATQWAYGNSLIRAGQVDQGFALIAKAAQANADYSNPAVATALQIFDGDAERVRQALGDVDGTNASLAAMMVSQKRFDDAFTSWSKVSDSARREKLAQLGRSLADQMAAAKQFRLAAGISASLQANETDRPAVGQIGNGGFENGVKLRNAPLFEWQIDEGSQPQVGLAEGQTHGGRYSVFAMFNTFETAAWRNIAQTVAVEPGAQYELELFYKSDLKTSSQLRWEVADAATGQAIASTPAMAAVADWTPLSTRFAVSRNSDGVIVRLVREGCAGPACQMNGKLSFDDFSLKRL